MKNIPLLFTYKKYLSIVLLCATPYCCTMLIPYNKAISSHAQRKIQRYPTPHSFFCTKINKDELSHPTAMSPLSPNINKQLVTLIKKNICHKQDKDVWQSKIHTLCTNNPREKNAIITELQTIIEEKNDVIPSARNAAELKQFVKNSMGLIACGAMVPPCSIATFYSGYQAFEYTVDLLCGNIDSCYSPVLQFFSAVPFAWVQTGAIALTTAFFWNKSQDYINDLDYSYLSKNIYIISDNKRYLKEIIKSHNKAYNETSSQKE